MLNEYKNKISLSYIETKYKFIENQYYFLENYSIMYIIDGKHIFESNYNKYEISKNTIKVINPNEIHKVYNSHFKYINFSIPITYMRSVAKELYSKDFKKLSIHSIIRDNASINLLIEIKKIMNTVDFNQKKFNEKMNLFVKNLIKNNIKEISFDNSQKESNIIKKVMEYVNDNLDEKITLNDLEVLLGLNKYQIINEFKKYTILTPIKFVYVIKTNIVKKMIKETDNSLSEIALLCGFSDQSNMIKNFKRIYNYTPKLVKNNVRTLYYN